MQNEGLAGDGAEVTRAADRWARQLADWALPNELIASAPESPWILSPNSFTPSITPPDTESYRRALEVAALGGSVLDVGAGRGAASLCLVPPATELICIDQSESMLASLHDDAAGLGLNVRTVLGNWLEVADTVPEVDLVLCHHVLYNVADLGNFIRLLDEHARHRVVIEITYKPPLSWLNPLFEHFHGITRPDRPNALDALEVIAEVGINAELEIFESAPRRNQSPDLIVQQARRQLCLDPTFDLELSRLIKPSPTRQIACIWWDRHRQ